MDPNQNVKAVATAMRAGAANIALELDDYSALARATMAELTRMGYAVVGKDGDE
jgi:hypothetical protein